MNKFILILVAAFFSFNVAPAQQLLSKVPANASLVIKYSGENFTKNVTVKKMESYPFVKDNLFKMLHVDSLTSLENTGIDFEKDILQYMNTVDSTMNFVSLLPLKNVSQFLKLIDAQSGAELKPEKKNGYEWLAISENVYAGWNNEWAIIVYSNYSNPNRYNYYYDYSASDSTTAVMDSVMMSMAVDSAVAAVPDTAVNVIPDFDAPKEPVKKPKTAKTKGTQKKPAPAVKNKQKAPVKKPVIVDEEIKEDVVKEKPNDEELNFPPPPPPPPMDYHDSIQEAKREARRIEQEKITIARQKKVSGEIIETGFNGTINSIENDISYKKIIDPAAHISGWFNYEDIMRQYWSFFYSSLMHYPRMYYSYDDAGNNGKGGIGLHSSMNVYFDKDKMRIEQKTFSPKEDMSGFGKDLFNSKQNADLARLVNPDNIGYLSASINTEAMAKYYYRWLKQYLSSTPYIGKYADLVDLYIDLLEIIIDEKAISELMPGNYIFVLHDMKTKEVSYTDYVYDDNFKYTEVKKTKQELSPNFTFAMDTKNEAFMKRVAAVPVKHAKEGDFNYKDKGGYYELVFDSGKNVLNSLFFMVKDGKVIITTSKDIIDMALNNTGYTLDAETKKSILKNNYSLKLNTKRLIQQIGPELNSGANKKISNYLQENLGDLKMESSLKDGMMQGTTTMAISGNHANSLEFFFNMINAINDIINKDKEEKEQKFN